MTGCKVRSWDKGKHGRAGLGIRHRQLADLESRHVHGFQESLQLRLLGWDYDGATLNAHVHELAVFAFEFIGPAAYRQIAFDVRSFFHLVTMTPSACRASSAPVPHHSHTARYGLELYARLSAGSGAPVRSRLTCQSRSWTVGS